MIFISNVERSYSLLVILVEDLSSPDPTSSPGSNKTDLLTGAGAPPDGGGLTNMLVITSSVGMLDGVHSNTTNLGPAVPLHFVFVVSTTSLQDGLVNTSTTGDQTDHGSVGGGDDLLGAGGQLDPGPVGVGVVGNHGGVVATGPGELPTVSGLLLEVADDCSLGHVANGHHVTDCQLGLLATVHELSGVHTFGGDEELLLDLVSVGVTEVDDSKRGATAGVVDDVTNDTLDVSMPLGVVHSSQAGLPLPVLGVGREDGPSALPLGSDHTTHFSCRSESSNISLVVLDLGV